jgi:ATP-dependent RNA helicase HelY
VQARTAAVKEALAKLRPGDVIFVPAARRRGLAVVLNNREGRPTVFAQDRKVFRVRPDHFQEAPAPVTRIQLPRSGSARSAGFRRDLAARLVALDVRPPRPARSEIDPKAEAQADSLERRAREHPCHACPEREKHERWAIRASKLEEQIRGVDRRVRARTETLARQFDRVLGVLEELGYVRGFTLLRKGHVLARIYGEGDILVSEALDGGLLRDLSAPEFAALISSMVYESRERVPRTGEMPTAQSAARYRRLSELWERVRRVEDNHHVELSRELDAGFALPVFHWAEGKPLEDILAETGMAPGDFVRSCKLLVDLLRQIEDVAPDDEARVAREAREAVNRGVVAYTGV